MPMRNSISFHQPWGQKPCFCDGSASGRTACAAEVVFMVSPWVLQCSNKTRRLGNELAKRSRRPCIHVATPVEVVVDLGGAAEHARVEEDREGCGFQVGLADLCGLQWLPQHLEQKRGDHRVD